MRTDQGVLGKGSGNAHLRTGSCSRPSFAQARPATEVGDGPATASKAPDTRSFLARASEGLARQQFEPARILRTARAAAEALRQLARGVQVRIDYCHQTSERQSKHSPARSRSGADGYDRVRPNFGARQPDAGSSATITWPLPR